MGIKVRRALNAFVLGVLAGLGALLISDQGRVSDAITVGDWTSLRILVVPVIVGAIGAAIRTVQSNVTVVPSPEPEENAK